MILSVATCRLLNVGANVLLWLCPPAAGPKPFARIPQTESSYDVKAHQRSKLIRGTRRRTYNNFGGVLQRHPMHGPIGCPAELLMITTGPTAARKNLFRKAFRCERLRSGR